MSAYDDARALLEAYAPDEPAQQRLRRDYLDHLAQHRDGLLRTCRPDHLTASIVVLTADAERVLLTLHARARRWFQLGGHIEPGDASLAAAADRELAEESGIESLTVQPMPVQLDCHAVDFCGPEPARHLDVRFLAVAPPDAMPTASEESLKVAWWPVSDLPSDEPSLHALVAAARTRLAATGGADLRL